MKLTDMQKAKDLAEARAKLIFQRDNVEVGSKEYDMLGITLQGVYQSFEFVDNIRPYVVEQLNLEIRLVERQLEDLGIDIS